MKPKIIHYQVKNQSGGKFALCAPMAFSRLKLSTRLADEVTCEVCKSKIHTPKGLQGREFSTVIFDDAIPDAMIAGAV